MSVLGRAYRDSLSLLNDLYQLTMAYAHWKEGTAEREAVFHLFFRKIPFGGGFAVACGLALAVEYIESLHFREDDLEYLGGLRGNDGAPLFEPGFGQALRQSAPLPGGPGAGLLRPQDAVDPGGAGDRGSIGRKIGEINNPAPGKAAGAATGPGDED